MHNNKMEWLNGEIRDREKVMLSLKRPDTPNMKHYTGKPQRGFKSRARTSG
jgi:hypothetical protein